jgi:hypothetical protein
MSSIELSLFANLSRRWAAVKPGDAKTPHSNRLEAAFSQKSNGLVDRDAMAEKSVMRSLDREVIRHAV